MNQDSETAFLEGLIELQYGVDTVQKLKPLAGKISWAKGWPQDVKAFWNAEAFMWGRKIDQEIRDIIARELRKLAKENNLDLGCGSYSYIPSTGFDLSQKMLDFNDNCVRKVLGDLEQELPFTSGEFNSVTAVFVLNYVKNYTGLLNEIVRVLKEGGVFMMVLSAQGINAWQAQKEVTSYLAVEWRGILANSGFNVTFYEKEKVWFFRCEKRKGY